MSGRIAVVDDKNVFLRWEDRTVVHREQLFHRSVHVLVCDRDGRLLLQRRQASKLTFPGYWDLSCSGHVEEEDYPSSPDTLTAAQLDVVYERCARRELAEELGIAAEVELVQHFSPEPDVHYEHLALFRAESDGPFVLQQEEVDEVRFVSAADLDALAGAGEKLTPTLLHFAPYAWEGPRKMRAK